MLEPLPPLCENAISEKRPNRLGAGHSKNFPPHAPPRTSAQRRRSPTVAPGGLQNAPEAGASPGYSAPLPAASAPWRAVPDPAGGPGPDAGDGGSTPGGAPGGAPRRPLAAFKTRRRRGAPPGTLGPSRRRQRPRRVAPGPAGGPGPYAEGDAASRRSAGPGLREPCGPDRRGSVSNLDTLRNQNT